MKHKLTLVLAAILVFAVCSEQQNTKVEPSSTEAEVQTEPTRGNPLL